MGGFEGGTGKNHKNIELLNNTCPDPLKNHRATKQAFSVRVSEMPFKYRFSGRQMMVLL